MGFKYPLYKICIVGDFRVGKTTLLNQYLEKRFTPNVTSTIGSNFYVKRIKIPNVKNLITLQIWDLAGQEHFKWVRHEFYKGAKGIVYVFDLTNRKSFENLTNWKAEIEKAIQRFSSVLVGNKLDLINSENRVIEKEESDKLKEFLMACGYFETSAKLGTCIDDFFLKLVSHIYKSLEK
ncbi:MAG: GTP-binding protein [Promethearchaeota archaeon]|nr:MAG: GTP-binding protein [Candidatus Lokiarchaeota archaeon]